MHLTATCRQGCATNLLAMGLAPACYLHFLLLFIFKSKRRATYATIWMCVYRYFNTGMSTASFYIFGSDNKGLGYIKVCYPGIRMQELKKATKTSVKLVCAP